MSDVITIKAKMYPKFAKDTHSIASANCLRVKPGGIVRPKKGTTGEPWESEILLIESAYGVEQLLDLSFNTVGEPGDTKYFVVTIPVKTPARLPGNTLISTYWLDIAPSYLTLEDATEAFEHAGSK